MEAGFMPDIVQINTNTNGIRGNGVIRKPMVENHLPERIKIIVQNKTAVVNDDRKGMIIIEDESVK